MLLIRHNRPRQGLRLARLVDREIVGSEGAFAAGDEVIGILSGPVAAQRPSEKTVALALESLNA